MIDNYKKLKTIPIKNRTPKAYFPNPNNRDYEIGFITRKNLLKI